jgi:hypothetical protein
MIRFIRDPQPPYTAYKAGMVRDLGTTLEALFKASGDAVDYTAAEPVFPPPSVIGGAAESPRRMLSDSQAGSAQALVLGAVNSTTAIRLAREARVASWEKGPLIVAPAYELTPTAYLTGDVRRLASGRHIVCSVAGTSAGAEPTMVFDGRPVTDGTVTWLLTEIVKTASDAGAPTVSYAATAAAAGLTTTLFASGATALSSYAGIRGAKAVNRTSTYVGAYAFANGPAAGSGNATANATTAAPAGPGLSGDVFQVNLWALEIVVTDVKFGFVLHNSTGVNYCIEVDGQLLEANPTRHDGTGNKVIVLDFNGVCKRRVVRLVGIDIGLLCKGVALTSQGYFEVPPASVDSMIYFGDSIGSTVTPTTVASLPGGGHLGFWLERYLGITELILANVGGSGYVSQNANTYNIPNLLANANNAAILPTYNARHVLIAAGFNDRGGDRAATLSAALSTWRAARVMFPTAKITVLDGYPAGSGPDANAISLSADLATQFAVWNDPNSRYIQTVGASAATAWIQGTGLTSNAVTAGNSSLFSGDANHPGPAGCRYYAQRISAAMRTAWGNDF